MPLAVSTGGRWRLSRRQGPAGKEIQCKDDNQAGKCWTWGHPERVKMSWNILGAGHEVGEGH